MITSSTLRGLIGESQISAVVEEIRRDSNFVEFFQTYMNDEDPQVSRNAHWALTKATNLELAQIRPMLDVLIDHAMQTPHSAQRRLTLNVIERLKLEEEELRTDFLDFCLERMTSLQETPGVQSLCMKLAYRMCSFYPELMDELHRTLKAMDMEYYTAAARSVRKKILTGKPC